MIIGFMRNGRKPFSYVRLLAKTCKYNDIDLVYFNPGDIDIKKKVIKGKFLINNKWITKNTSVPSFIDTTPYCLKKTEIGKFLRENSTLSTDKIGTKDEIYQKIKEDGEFSHLLIPTGAHKNFLDFLGFINEHDQIIVKPRSGLRGHNIYMIKKLKRNTFLFSYQQNETKISKRI